MSEEKYNLSFIGGGLLLAELVLVAEQLVKLNDWVKVENKVMDENLLQSRTVSTSKRFFNEIKNRVSELNQAELKLLIDGNDDEQKQILWVAICRKHKFIMIFITQQKDLSYEHSLPKLKRFFIFFWRSRAT